MMKRTRNRKNRMRDISAEMAATPGRPKAPVISAINRNKIAHFNMVNPPVVFNELNNTQ
jgi:hypothetical protein